MADDSPVYPLRAPDFDWYSPAELHRYVQELTSFYEYHLNDEDSIAHDPLPWDILDELEAAAWALDRGDLGTCRGCIETVDYLAELLRARQEAIAQGRQIAERDRTLPATERKQFVAEHDGATLTRSYERLRASSVKLLDQEIYERIFKQLEAGTLRLQGVPPPSVTAVAARIQRYRRLLR